MSRRTPAEASASGVPEAGGGLAAPPAGHCLGVAPRAMAGWAGGNPMPVLARAAARRGRPPAPWLWWLVLGVPALALEFLPPLPRPWLMGALALLAAAVPLHAACGGAALLAGLRRGRGLEEVLITPTTPREIVDGLAGQAAGAVLSGWGWLGSLWLLWGVQILGLSPPGALLLVPAGLALQAALAAAASYVSQAGHAWSDGENDLSCRYLVVAPALAPGAALLVLPPLLRSLAPAAAPGPGASAALALAGLLGLALAARALAAAGLVSHDRVRASSSRLWRRLVLGRSLLRAQAARLRNAIVYRESRAEVGRSPGGLPGLLAGRHWLAALALAGLLATAEAGLRQGWPGLVRLLWSGTVILFLLQTMRAAYGTVGSLVEEREGGTLETLLGTALTPWEFADGWARVSALPRTLENLAGAGALVGLALLTGTPPDRVALCAWLVVSFTVAAAYAGVAVSASSAGRQAALDRMGLVLAGGLWLVGMLGLLVAFHGRQEYIPAAAGLGAAAVVACRGRALGLLGGEAGPAPGAGRLEGLLPRPLRARLQRRRTAAALAEALPGRVPADFHARLMARMAAEGLTRDGGES